MIQLSSFLRFVISLIVCGSVFYLFVTELSWDNEAVLQSHPSGSKPIILEWNPYVRKIINYETFQCAKKCIFTRDKRLEPNATVITYYVGSMDLTVYPQINSQKMNVFVNFEPPTLAPLLVPLPSDFFNYTVTYRVDSDVVMPYGCFTPVSENDPDKWDAKEVRKLC